MSDILILREAEVELWTTVAYYESKALGLGLDFENEIECEILSKQSDATGRLSNPIAVSTTPPRFRSTTFYPLRRRCLCATLPLKGIALCFCCARDLTGSLGHTRMLNCDRPWTTILEVILWR